MDRRTHEGPMDFEYQNGTGPIDGRSPFAQVSGNQRSFASIGMDSPSKKRGIRSAFGSPPKNEAPSLRNAHTAQPHSYSHPTFPPSPSKSFSATPFTLKPNSSFFTPRKLDNDIASSGGETPQSPTHDQSILDSDATPDNSSMNFRGVAARFDHATMPAVPNGCSNSPTRVKDKKLEKAKGEDKRRDSWWSRAAGLVSYSPSSNTHAAGRGEIARGHSTVQHDKVAKKAAKKRRGDAVRQLIRSRKGSYSDSEDSRPPSPSKSKRRFGLRSTSRKHSDSASSDEGAPVREKGTWWSMAEFLTQHPTLPQILSWYAQLTLNTFLICGIMYLLYSFYATVRGDIDKRSMEAAGELLAEMAICAKHWKENRCDPSTRVPAMETVCNNWQKCMDQDVKAIGRARISVGMWAEIFNGFVDPISWKTMFFTIIIVFGCVALSNLPFSMIRHKADQAAANHHHYYGNGPVPPTPGRQLSNPGQLQDGYWTPHHQNFGLEPAPSQGFGQIEGRESPVKRLQFR